jgi:hypothetical protein
MDLKLLRKSSRPLAVALFPPFAAQSGHAFLFEVRLSNALRRTVTGESLFITFFRSNGPGEAGFAGSYPAEYNAAEDAPGVVRKPQGRRRTLAAGCAERVVGRQRRLSDQAPFFFHQAIKSG